MSRPGEVVRIRVNPKDMMGVVDVVRTLGFNYHGMTFSQATSIAFSAMLNMLRETGSIPTRDGFEFSDMIQPFTIKPESRRNLNLAKPLTLAESTQPTTKASSKLVPNPSYSKEQRQAKFRLEELAIKRESGEIMSEEDEAEWTRLITLLYSVTDEAPASNKHSQTC